jgi:serine/threonine-protein kinase RsbW
MKQVRRWTLASDVQGIGPVIDEIVRLCHLAGFSSRHCQLNVPIAVTEAIANAMLRGNENDERRQVGIVAVVGDVQLVVEVSDEGCGFDLGGVVQSPEDVDWLERERGRGVFLMRSLMDAVENTGPGVAGGHRLRLTLHRA